MNNLKTGRFFFQYILIIFLFTAGLFVMAQSPPPTAVTTAASGVGAYEATLNGTVNANGVSTTVTFEYGLTTGYGFTFPAVPSPVTGAADTGVSAIIYELSPNTTYHYRVVAQSVNGMTYGADMTFTTSSLPPGVLTDAASAIAGGNATLNGTVNARGMTTTVTFEYGLDTNYGTTVTADQSPVSFSQPIGVSKTISGLASNSVYHFRAVAVNSGGTTYGADMTFTTGAAAPTATTHAATAVGSEIATLNGMVNANGTQAAVSFEYGLDTGYGTVVTAIQSPLTGTTDTAVNAIIEDVLPNTTYHYRILAVTAAGTTYGADMTFTTLPLPPTAVTNMASAIGTTGATFNGTVNANDNGTTVTFQYGLDTQYGATVTADQNPVSGAVDTAVSKAVTGLTNNTTYHYRVVAVNSGGTTYGADMTFITGAAAPTATTHAATAVGTATATLNGLVNANNDTAAVTFQYGTGTNYSRTIDAVPGSASGSADTAVTAFIANLTPNTTYHFRVKAKNSNGTTYGAEMTFTTKAAPTVITAAASAVSTSGGTLNGTINANGDISTITFEYGLDTNYGTTVTADQSPVSGSGSTAVSKTITGLTGNTIYHYRVVGQNVNGTTYGGDMTFITMVGAPTVTTGAAASVTSDGAMLQGTVSANNSSTTVTFEYGTTTAYGTTVTADQSPVIGVNAAVSKTLTGLSNTTTYHYRAVGQNAYGTTYGADMTFSTSYTPTAVTKAATAVGGSSATLNGLVNANNFTTTVTFEYGLTTSYGSTVTADQSPAFGTDDTAVSKTIIGLLNTTTYHYRVKAQGFGTTYGADMSFTTGASPTAVTNAASAVGGTSATLNGTVNANNSSTTVTFEYGETTSYGRVLTAAQSPFTGSTDTAVNITAVDLASNTVYHYRVVAQNANDTVYGADMSFTTTGIPPTAATQTASAVSGTGATLNGTVNANNDSTTVTFEYGLTATYGTTVTADQSPVSGDSNTGVSASLTGLTGSTTYHYRVVAQNSSGTTYGTDMTFYTGTSVPTATTGAATNVGDTTATLNGTVNANNNSAIVTFEYGPDTDYGRLAAADQGPVTGTTDTAVSADITDLLIDSTYHYRVVAQNSSGTFYGADMTFFTGSAANLPTVTTAGVTKITTKSAKSGGNVIDEGAAPVTVRGVCWSTSPNPTTTDRFTVNDSGPGEFISTLNQLTSSTTYYVRAYATNSYGTAYGEEFQFTTNSSDIRIVIKRPHDGDEVSGTVMIKAVARGSAGSQSIAKVEFYIDDTKIADVTKVPFKTAWDTTAFGSGSYIIKAVAYGKSGESSEDSITVTVTGSQAMAPEISTNRDRLVFGAVKRGKGKFHVTGPQKISITNSGGGKLKWIISSGSRWLSVSKRLGKGSRNVKVYVNPRGMAPGSYTGFLKIKSPNASNRKVIVNVGLTIYNPGTTAPPFGSFETPVDGTTASGNIPVSGWALDDIEVTGVKIYRSRVGDEAGDLIFIGDAVSLNGAQPELGQNYIDSPLSYRAGWGYLLMSNLLPNQGSGSFTLFATATDKEGNTFTLGSKTINIANTNAVQPFGSIDTPATGEIVKGAGISNSGWALTAQYNAAIPTDGSTITVWLDGMAIGSPVYNQYKENIATLFPGYTNSAGAGAKIDLDTTTFSSGMHTIVWSAEDSAGNISAVGSRYFSIEINEESGNTIPLGMTFNRLGDLDHIESRQPGPDFSIKKGYRLDREAEILFLDEKGIAAVTLKELEPIEVELGHHITAAKGYLVTGSSLSDLPSGSTLDQKSGRFSWIPGPGYSGTYLMVFVTKDMEGRYNRTFLQIDIEPKFEK